MIPANEVVELPSREARRGTSAFRALRTLAVVLTVGGYTLVAPVGYLGFAFLCRVWRKEPLRCARRMQRCMGFGYRFMHAWLRWLRIADFDHRGALPDLPSGPCVVIANHPTQLDVTAIGACLGGGCTVVKPRIYRRRLLTPLLRGAGLLEGPGEDPASIGRTIADGVQRLRDGMRLFAFPEGARSPPGGLHPFGRVVFEIARRADVPVVSVGVRCEPLWLTHEVPLFRPPHPMPRLRLTLLARDEPAAFGDSRALRTHVEARYRAWLGPAFSTDG
jgi:1-acyl-sn-glycerol-3-phosphate acyltransferase